MLIIANAYRRLNMWNANAGASFEWVGRAINQYLGFRAGWLMVAAYVLGAISGRRHQGHRAPSSAWPWSNT